MPVLGITGGAASGKSTFSNLLAEHLPNVRIFSADAEVRRLTEEDSGVRSEISAFIGPEAFSAEGTYNRKWVRDLIFKEPALRKALNAILHPRVRAAWVGLAQECLRKSRSDNWLLVEIPLLYETGGELWCDRVVALGCTAQTQLNRLIKLRGLTPNLAEQIRVAQSSLEEKSTRADHLIWNDCPFICLTRQAALCASWLRTHFA